MRSNSPARQDQACEPPCGLTSVRNSSTAPPHHRRTGPNDLAHTTRTTANRPSVASSSIRPRPAHCPLATRTANHLVHPRFTSPVALSRKILIPIGHRRPFVLSSPTPGNTLPPPSPASLPHTPIRACPDRSRGPRGQRFGDPKPVRRKGHRPSHAALHTPTTAIQVFRGLANSHRQTVSEPNN